jgi:hypothetical protein
MNGDPSQSEPDERTIRALASLADGSLHGRERARLEDRIASSPGLRAAFERQRAGVTALRGLELAAPAELRARVEGARASARRVAPRRRRWTVAVPIAAAAAAAGLLAALLLPGDETGPTVPQAADLYQRPPAAAVEVDPSQPNLLAANVEGVPFPNLRREFGWRAAGTRTDELDGRLARTVFYRRAGKRVAYTIVSGDGIRAPADSHPSRLNGVNLHSFDSGGRRVVTWWRDGRTCVLSASGVGGRQLLTLASWKGDGAVPF